jgi:DNA primase
MKKRFSSEELFELRNAIPIQVLIKDLLGIPGKTTDGFFHFLCPICHEFQTAINPRTNLARCFLCRKNFNAIDLVMLVKESGFIESVAYLKGVLNHRRQVSQMFSAIGRPM